MSNCTRFTAATAAGLLALFTPALLSAAVVINEIHYDGEDPTVREEFVELVNTGAEEVDLSGWFFSEGIHFEFPPGTRLGPGAFAVVAEDPATLQSLHHVTGAFGPYSQRLRSDGETIVLRSATGQIEDTVDYGVGFPWPVAAAGKGSSLELINPSLDNDLGCSWRASGFSVNLPAARRYLLRREDTSWLYRKGSSEASTPATAWREPDFTPDGTWLTGQTSIGFSDDDDKTVIDDMLNNYSSLYLRHELTIGPEEEIPTALKINYYLDDGCVIWINGVEVLRVNVAAGEQAYNALATRGVEADWIAVNVPNPSAVLHRGRNVIAVHAFNQRLASNDFSFDLELFVPGLEDLDPNAFGPPTPGARNSIFAENAPPQIRQVDHTPKIPPAGTDILVTARVTDPDGVASVELLHQLVRPGSYVPATIPLTYAQLLQNPNQPQAPYPAFEDPASWTTIAMHDDGKDGDAVAGDQTYSVKIPAQENRTLVRYRIAVADTKGLQARVPFQDDPSLNFACFVYNGVPPYAATKASVHPEGAGHVYPVEVMESLPVYTLIAREQDITECVAANTAVQIPQGTEARFAENWEGAFVAYGVVHDHVHFRLRGANGRYQVPSNNAANIAGKRHWRVKFNKGAFFQARDKFGEEYPTRWSVLNTDRLFGNRLDGNFGLGDQLNDILWNRYGVPSPFGNHFHFRVLDGVDEAPTGLDGQYLGDFWGIARGFENYDARFLDAHKLPKGNLYKLVNQTNSASAQQRYQAPDAVKNGADHDNIQNNCTPAQTEAWLLTYVNYEEWFRYHSICQAIRHYDYWPDANKNATWYFEPVYTAENKFYGRMWTMPYDTDATWGPSWNDGKDRPYDAIFGGAGKPNLQRGYRNHIREVRDLLWQRVELERIIRQTASFLDALEEADIDRWKNAPAQAGRQFFPSAREGTLEGKIKDMLAFAFTGGSWAGGTVGAGGRGAFLDTYDQVDLKNLPRRPSITYRGEAAYPQDGLHFESSAFDDPQGAADFRAVEWRIAEVSTLPDPGTLPLSDPAWREAPVPLEIRAAWSTEITAAGELTVTIPSWVVEQGKTYRVRARMHDVLGLASHWSEPIELLVGAPAAPSSAQTFLRITEIMYHPSGDEAFEYLELQNTGGAPVDLENVQIRGGVQFSFSGSAIKTLGPGQFVLVVKDQVVFERRYGAGKLAIAGEYSGNLSNGGEDLELVDGKSQGILLFAYADDWYSSTDGGGRSLVIVNPRAPAESWGLAESWAPSAEADGSPGRADGPAPTGLQLPGDLSQDSRLDVTDAIVILRVLTSEPNPTLPCGDGTIEDASNKALLDIDADGRFNLTDPIVLLRYLFQGGPPPALGVDCTAVVGCRDACGA